jgi:hypothetical protein
MILLVPAKCLDDEEYNNLLTLIVDVFSNNFVELIENKYSNNSIYVFISHIEYMLMCQKYKSNRVYFEIDQLYRKKTPHDLASKMMERTFKTYKI